MVEEKQKQRKLMKKMKINKYLADSDSDFQDHDSVKNEKVDKSYKRDYVIG